jgi:hypothetical protein
MSIIDKVHHRGCYDETSTSSVRQWLKLMPRGLREIGTATLQLCERMLQENTDIAVNVCAV